MLYPKPLNPHKFYRLTTLILVKINCQVDFSIISIFFIVQKIMSGAIAIPNCKVKESLLHNPCPNREFRGALSDFPLPVYKILKRPN